jgi:hypothetical protein
MSTSSPLDPPSTHDTPEACPAGCTWWTRHTADGPVHLLELPPGPDGHGIELQLLHAGVHTLWAWRTDTGGLLCVVGGARC